MSPPFSLLQTSLDQQVERSVSSADAAPPTGMCDRRLSQHDRSSQSTTMLQTGGRTHRFYELQQPLQHLANVFGSNTCMQDSVGVHTPAI